MWTERTELLVGKDGLEKLAAAHVIVAGVGGVGGYAAEMLVRAGVGHLTIIDADTVSESNLNRQLLAMTSTVGKIKTDVLSARLLDINPSLDLKTVSEYLEPDTLPQQIGTDCDFLVDAIDTLSPKLYLIKHCVDSGIPLVSSMGAGAKFDVTKVRIADISKSFNCPLAYIVRKRLRHLGISKGFKVVFSEEIPEASAIVPCEERNKKSMVGTISYIPAVFGCACAQVAISSLLQNH